MRGTEIVVGSLFAMAYTAASSGYMRVGRVIELIPTKQTQWGHDVPEKIRVKWLYGSGYSTPEKPSILENFRRGLVLPDDFPTTKA